MTDLPLFVTAAIVADQIRLRVYASGKIKAEVTLRRQQALGLGAQLVQMGMLPEYPVLLEPQEQQDVAGHSASGSGNGR